MQEAVPDDLRERSIRGGTAIFVGQGLRFFLTFASQIVLARLLSPAEFGIVAMVAPILGIVQLFTDFGLGHAVVQRANITQRELSTIFWLNIALSVTAAGLFAAMSPVIAWMYGEPRVALVTQASSLLIAIGGAGQLHGFLVSRNMQFTRIAIIDGTSLVLGIAAGVMSAMAGWGYWALVVNQAVASLTTAVLNWAYSGWRPSRPGGFRAILPMLRYGGDVTGLKLVQYLSVSVDKTLIGIRAGEVALGIYDRAWKLGWAPFSQLAVPVDRLAFPILSRLNADPPRYRNVFVPLFQVLALIIMPGLLFAVFQADTLIRFLFGVRWLAAGPIFQWIALGTMAMPVSMASGWLFLTQARTKQYLTCTVIASIVTILAYIAGLPWGPTGVAAGATIALYLVQLPLFVIVSTRSGHVSLRLMLETLAPVAFGLGVAASTLALVTRIDAIHGFPAIFLSLVTAYASTLVTLMALPSGRVLLRRAVALSSAFRRGAVS
jgi:PST family polysaccharide transporter